MCELNNHGFITLIIGPMFSGKTTTLIDLCERYTIAGKKCLLVKHSSDNRYSNDEIITHSGLTCKQTTTNTGSLGDIDTIVHDFDVIGIDEIQFYEDAPKYCNEWANNGHTVICAGLNGTFERKEFRVISKLIPLSEKIIQKHAVCRETGNNATFSYKISNNKDIIDIGGSDKYIAVDRKTFNQLEKKNIKN